MTGITIVTAGWFWQCLYYFDCSQVVLQFHTVSDLETISHASWSGNISFLYRNTAFRSQGLLAVSLQTTMAAVLEVMNIT